MTTPDLNRSDDLRISHAQPANLGAVVELLDSNARWMRERGIKQWETPPPPSFVLLLEDDIATGCVFVARLSGSDELVGTFRLEWAEEDLWHDSGSDQAAYLYSLAVRPDMRGQHIGGRLLGWAADYVRGQGCRFLRLDCIASNPVLRRYYAAQGFTPRGEARHGNATYALFELRLS
ncbi:MAG: GNAT family N-acetyltransferase [Chloroflexaceae bacterium]|nr:GNAT family N-acetyltransferase [Chloroflexaceae bacterium]